MARKILISSRELSKILGVAPSTITRKLASGGSLNQSIFDGRINLYHECVLAEFKKRNVEIPKPGYVAKLARTNTAKSSKLVRDKVEEPQTENKPNEKTPKQKPIPRLETLKRKGEAVTKANQAKIDISEIRKEKARQKSKAPKTIDEVDFHSFESGAEDEYEEIKDLTVGQVVETFGGIPEYKFFLDALKTMMDVKAKKLAIAEKEGSLISRDFVKLHLFSYIEEANSRLLNDLPRSISARTRDHFASDGDIEGAEDLVRKMISQVIKGVKTKATRAIKEKG